jgi:hypothetical protein
MIERAEGEDPERYAGSGKHAGHGADATVAAADNDGIDCPASCFGARPHRSLAEFFAFDEPEIGGNTVLGEGVGEPLLDIGGKGLAEGAGAGVGKHDGTPHRDPLKRRGTEIG